MRVCTFIFLLFDCSWSRKKVEIGFMKITIVDGNQIAWVVFIIYGLLSYFLARLLIKVTRTRFAILSIADLICTHFLLVGFLNYCRSLQVKNIYVGFGHAYVGFFILYALLFIVALVTILGSMLYRKLKKGVSVDG
jgi:hypothetical protein